ncbi:ABC-type transport auxiliary lipoprotein family protein [Rhodovulum steppense]|uniref:Cholesterol transport system auxiliary component n=1 Tax=Rhodovulum steppense TaxID=540251 RepID=A0A4R1Z0Q3_9RHOB|nr:ABC-type transport auxiliary lipoprotein family protein [Rhodovulum steppense]TCM87138.1 cholesterol transport system auxiliary component [Rhodovulum steppense]
MNRRLLLVALSATALSGCSAIGALNTASAALDVYQLRAPDFGPVATGRPQSLSVVIEVPTASGALDTDRILIRPTPSQIQYLSDARWAETAPVMVQTALVEGLERSGAFRFVARRPLGASGDYALVTLLRDFQAEIDPATGQSMVRIALTARLVRESDAAIVALQTFSAEMPAASTRTPDLIAAFQTASDRTLDAIMRWLLVTRNVGVARS